MKITSQTVNLRFIEVTEGKAIIKKIDYEKEQSPENLALPEDEQYKAHRYLDTLYLAKSEDGSEYIEI